LTPGVISLHVVRCRRASPANYDFIGNIARITSVEGSIGVAQRARASITRRGSDTMRALVWRGTTDIRCDTVPDPKIEAGRDAIVKVTSYAICGSDLHLYNHFMPGMKKGDVMGHELMGAVVEVGRDNKKLKVGDRVVVPFTIICGECEQCRRGYYSVCERTNRNKDLASKVFGHTTAGLFGYTHLTGGYQRGQAEYVRVPYADATHVKCPAG
jgi:threonine dehydrogenase-like Zn-dependent dehydrogenase